MPVLLALSLLTFVALFWAAFSILGAVRRARRRRRAKATSVAASGTAPLNSNPHEILYADPEAVAHPVAPPPAIDAPPPPGLRNFPTRLGKHTLASSGSDDSWAKWNPFGSDYADLTDPAPSRRSRKVHGRNKDRSR